jgi:hypothetical protein
MEWGPILWKYLHILAERIGTGNAIIDTDQSNYMETLLTMLPLIIPCTECQEHTATYMKYNPVPSLKGLYKNDLREAVRNWLFLFHNEIRIRKEQSIIVDSIEKCIQLYSGVLLQKCEYNFLIQSVAAAVRQGWVRIDNWRKWYSNAEKMRIISGNCVI